MNGPHYTHHFNTHQGHTEGFVRAERGRGPGAEKGLAEEAKGAGLSVQTVAWELLLGGYTLEGAVEFLQV
jgi:hypothetical protein